MKGRFVRHAAAAMLIVIISVSTAVAEPAAPAVLKLRHKIDTYLESPALSQSHVGIKVVSLKTGEVLYTRGNKLLFHPASTLKLFTTSAALTRLGAGFRFKTTVSADSPDIAEGTLHANLYLKGFADPLLTTDDLSWMAVELKARGIERVTGDLVCDETYLDNNYYGRGWMREDYSSCHYAPIGGLTVNNNCVVVRVRPGSGAGEPPAVTLEPQIPYITIKNTAFSLITADEQNGSTLNVIRDWHEPDNVITVTGDIAIDQPEQTFTVTLTPPVPYACRLFSDILAAHKIEVAGKIRYGAVPDEYTELTSYASAPLSEIIKDINKQSINLYSELLMKTLGAELQSPPGTAAKGIAEIKAFIKQIGMDADSVEIADGSGVSRYNLISPDHLVGLLSAVSDLSEPFIESLSIAGVDGTLQFRMRSTPAEERLKAKTGSMAGVRTIAGFTATQDGEAVVFSIMIENFVVDPGVITDIQDRILVLISSFSRNR
ncbi:D-alanyl-D-alanine carboxypeptidase/D-alanyl-D-alanine endopeptidase [Candidatus Magnetominusculus xianensis]|uniref:Peptidase S13 n=1 Tax=Candidatus Magnetominusculus xianensis TaxID=1748249 RepID=A0ABR5SCU9_9BACT|nr:D-alanyl-D-alanine carboxypeptidase/D-alanyl-D-alanine-endopeptidase [Candidatus Magnetominusculus xianensis]KWT75013.1 peptidase S13 [Candidatus Magnetominusculus xianensis]MBF0405637.1 D-alanyl-D-alanine carboxypeptidase/D-alanyl-D-alanine-endopeptidase [Nitrospirota bacterium]